MMELPNSECSKPRWRSSKTQIGEALSAILQPGIHDMQENVQSHALVGRRTDS